MTEQPPSPPDDRVDQPWQWGDPFDPDAIPTSTRSERAGLSRPLAEGFASLDITSAIAVLTRVPKAEGEPDEVAAPRPNEALEAELRRDHLLLLQTLPPTEHTLQVLVRLEADIAAGSPNLAVLEQHRASLLRQLELSRERDALFEARPDGCWCLGAGGRSPTALVPEIDGRPITIALPDDEPLPLRFRVLCGCPEATAERARVRADAERIKAHYRRQRADRLFGQARIPEGYAGLDLSTYPDQALAARVERWYSLNLNRQAGQTVDDRVQPCLFMSGPNQRGKTGLAIGIVKLALGHDTAAVFRDVPALCDELAATYDPENPGCFAEILTALKEIPLLVLDDLGAQRTTDFRSEVLYSVLNHRMNEQLMTVITTNFGWPEGATAFVPNDLSHQVGERIVWRIQSMSNHLPVRGDVLPRRVQQAQPAGNSFEKW